MKKIKILADFRFAERGVEVVEYAAGDVAEVSDECADVAITEKWAEAADDGAPARRGRRANPTPETLDPVFEQKAE